MKKIFYIALAAAFALAAVSCSDKFLEEEMVATITQDYLATEQGLDQLIVSSYNAERLRFGYTEVENFEIGHDAAVMNNASVNNFSTSEWSSTGRIATQCNYYMGFQSKQQSGFNINCFPVIDNCNKAINAIRGGTALGKYASDKEYAAQKLSEVLFNRDYLFYSLNTLLGDIPVSQVSITALPDNYYYPRMSSADLWSMLIGDMRYAVEHLPSTYGSSEFGKITKGAAAHFLAKLYLQRAQGAEYGTSEYGRNSDGSIDNSNAKSYLGMLYKGKGTADLDSVIYYENLVIESGVYELEPYFEDIFTVGLDDYTNESSSEIILPALFADGADSYRYGERCIAFFGTQYTDVLWGIPDYVWEYATKPSFHYHCNDWGIDMFTDKVNDSRYQGTFAVEYQTAIRGGTSSAKAANVDYYGYTDSKNATYQWTAAQAEYFNKNILPTYDRKSWGGRQAVAGEHKMGTGDLAVAFLENDYEDAISTEYVEALPYVLFARWMKTPDGKYLYRPQIVNSGKTYSFASAVKCWSLENGSNKGVASVKKYDDPNRSSYNSVYGTRDIPVFRYAECFLVRAEAYGRKGNFSQAAEDINVLRQRAAFKPGVRVTGDKGAIARAQVIATVYPGHENLSTAEQSYPYTVTENSYDKIKVDPSFWDGTSANSKKEKYPASANTELKRFVNFIANEYGREFCEEVGPYYEYVHHAGVQAERIQYHHQMGSSSSTHEEWHASANVQGTNGQNGQAKGGFKEYMTLKPFPKTQFLDMLTDDKGVQYTDEQKNDYQNYGYNGK